MDKLLVFVAALAAPALTLGQAGSSTSPAAPQQAAPQQAAPQEAAPPVAAAKAPRALLEEIDALYKDRDAPGAMDRMGAKLLEAEKEHPQDYEILWRLSRHHFWLSDDPTLDKKKKSSIGKAAWEYGDRATVADPTRVEGWNYAAAGMGNYALGIGVFTALRQGIEGKFKERLSRAEKIDAKFENGAIFTAWGRFWYELPWPKYSAKRSREALQRALALNPDSVRAHVYLADLDQKEDEPARAKAELEKAIANPPGRYDPPEERRWQAAARERLAAKK
jgi:tetratricopeptide (TPR) repeat protein